MHAEAEALCCGTSPGPCSGSRGSHFDAAGRPHPERPAHIYAESLSEGRAYRVETIRLCCMGSPRPLPRWLSSDPSEPLDVAALPYLERQAILVVTPEEAEDSRRSLMAAAAGEWRPRSSVSLDVAGQQAAWRGLQLASL